MKYKVKVMDSRVVLNNIVVTKECLIKMAEKNKEYIYEDGCLYAFVESRISVDDFKKTSMSFLDLTNES